MLLRLIWVLLFFPTVAVALPPAQVQLLSSGAPLDWPIKADWKWEKNAEGATILHLSAVIDVPEDVTEAKTQNSTIRLKLEKQKLNIESGAQHGEIQLKKAGVASVYQLIITPPKPPLFVSNCRKLGLKIKSDVATLPFFVAARCVHFKDKTKERNELHLTFPEEADVDQSTLFEQQGKGESWRIYELGKVDAGSQENGRIVLRYENKSYLITLEWEKVGKEEPVAKQPFEKNFSLGLGYDMLSLQGNASGSSQQFLILLKILPTLFSLNLGFGADLNVTFGLSQSSNSMSHLQFAPYAFYRLLQTKTFVFDPRAYFVVASDQQDSSGVGFHTTQFGVGFMAAYQIAKFWQTHLEIMSQSFGSQVIKSHYFVDLGFNEVGRERGLRWGGGVQLQSYGVQDASGLNYQFMETALYGLILF